MNNLSSAIEQFSDWRNSKRYGGEKIPEKLWGIACVAASEHDVVSVARAIGVSTHQLRSRLKKIPSEIPSSIKPVGGVMVFPSTEIETRQNQSYIAEILIGNKLLMRIPPCVSQDHLKSLLQVALEVL